MRNLFSLYKHFLMICFVFIGIGCTSGAGGNSNTTPESPAKTEVEIGQLPNGATVAISENDIPIDNKAGGSSKVTVSIKNDSSAESYVLDFSTIRSLNKLSSSKRHNALSDEMSGLQVTPANCVVGGSASGFSNSCEITISSVGAQPGTYNIVPSVTLGSGEVMFLAPITLGVSKSETSDTKSILSFEINQIQASIIGDNIKLILPSGTSLQSLAASFITDGLSVTVNGINQVSKETVNDFTNPLTYTVTAENGTSRNYTVTVEVAKSDAKSISEFSLNGISGVISGSNISIIMPYGTDVKSLIATFSTTGQTVSVNGVEQTNKITANDFTSPVVYIVTAEDGSTSNYTVTVEVAKSDAKAITGFLLDGVSGVISESDINVTMPYGTDVKSLVATFSTTGQTVSVNGIEQSNGVTKNDYTNPVVYTVTAEDGSISDYTVTVTVAQNDAKAITEFSLDGVSGVISESNIYVNMPYGTDVKSLIATFSSTGQIVSVNSIDQTNKVTANDFTNPVVYTVTAADGTTADYLVVVTVAASDAKSFTNFSISGISGDINNDTIEIILPFKTDITKLKPVFKFTGKSVKVGNIVQVSGVTENDFTQPVIYTITADNNSTKNYKVHAVVLSNATFKNIIYSSSSGDIDKSVSSHDLETVSHLLLAFVDLDKSTNSGKYAWNGGVDENGNKLIVKGKDTHAWGNAELSSTNNLIENIKYLHSKGVKVLVSLRPSQAFIDDVDNGVITNAELKSITDKLKLFLDNYGLDGFDYDYEPSMARAGGVTVAGLNKFLESVRSSLGLKAIISITPQYWLVPSANGKDFFDYTKNSNMLNKINWIAIQFYDMKSPQLLDPNYLIGRYSYYTEDLKLPADKIVYGFANAANDDQKGFAFSPNSLLTKILVPLVGKVGAENFGGIMAWRLSGDTYYGDSWVRTITAFFRGNLQITSDSKFSVSYKADASKYVYTPCKGLYKNSDSGVIWTLDDKLTEQLPNRNETKPLALLDDGTLFILNRLDKSISYVKNDSHIPSKVYLDDIYDDKNVNIGEINYITSDVDTVYLLSTRGFFKSVIDNSSGKVSFKVVPYSGFITGSTFTGMSFNSGFVAFSSSNNKEGIYWYDKKTDKILPWIPLLPAPVGNIRSVIELVNMGKCYFAAIKTDDNIAYWQNRVTLDGWIPFENGQYTGYCRITLH